MIWFTSDLHFGHDRIISHCNRPFATTEEMDTTMIKNWNDRVSHSDTVYVVGDFSFRSSKRIQEYVNVLNGKIVLIEGNHDKKNPQIKEVFGICPQILTVKYYKQRIVLCHYSLKNWQGRSRDIIPSWNLYGHGHCHHAENIFDLSMDVGVDGNNFFPYSFEEIQIIMVRKQRCWEELVNSNKIISRKNGWL